jgi:hypothetical protein
MIRGYLPEKGPYLTPSRKYLTRNVERTAKMYGTIAAAGSDKSDGDEDGTAPRGTRSYLPVRINW